MKLKFTLCLLLLASAVPAFAADAVAVLTNSLVLVGTNDTNVVLGPPKELPPEFTNSAGMLLIKVGGIWVGKYEVTQKEFQKIMDNNPSAFPGSTHPVDSVSWNDAMSFCQKMTDEDTKKMKIPVGFYYTLPTEDQWQSFVADASLDDSVTSLNGDRGGTSPVGSLRPNSLGLYDIRGNVMEFTLGDDSKPYRVLLGGSWQDSIDINLRPEFRFYTPPDNHQNTFGFRCILTKR